jgi:hypothetical protein
MDTAGGAEEQEEAKQRATDAQAVAQAAKAEAERLAREADEAIEAASRAAGKRPLKGAKPANHVAALAASTPIMASPPRVQRDTTGLGALASMAVSASPEAKKKRSE